MTLRRSFVLLLTGLFLAMGPVATAAQQAGGTTYYVSPSGADSGPGTVDDPWRTIEASLSRLEAGDVLIVRAGTYEERVEPSSLKPAGQSNRILVRAAPGERPVIRGRLYLPGISHWHIRGISVTSDGGSYTAADNLVKIMNGVGWTFQGGEVWGAKQTSAAVFIGTTKSAEPRDWRFVGNCVHDTAPRDATNRPNEDHNIYVYNGANSGSGVIERNVLYGAPNGENIKLGPDQGNVAVRHNTMHQAAMNMLLTEQAHHNVIEHNLMGRGSPAPGKDWYPNIRGFDLKGAGNVARYNAGFEASQFVLVGKDGGGSTATISQTGNHFPVTPHLDRTGRCDGLYPTNASYRRYGAYAPVSSGDPVQRVSGTGRVETSIAISKTARPTGGAANVVIARADTYPDALAGAPLAAALDAPILLSGGKSLHPAVKDEIKRLGADKAVLLGGKAALSDQVAKDLQAMNVTVQRVEGGDRFATAAAVATELGKLSGTDIENPYVVEGQDPDPNRGWPDAVAVGFLAAQQKRPILLVTTETLPAATNTALKDSGAERATIVGGTASVSDSVAKAIDQNAASVGRIAGDSRYHTSRLVAEAAVKAGASAGKPWFATGAAFPDALAAGPAVAKDGGVLLLVPGHTTFLNGEATDWLDRFSDSIDRLRLIGGPAAVSHAIEDKSRHQLLFE